MASEVIYFTISELILVMRCKGNHFLSYSIHNIVFFGSTDIVRG